MLTGGRRLSTREGVAFHRRITAAWHVGGATTEPHLRPDPGARVHGPSACYLPGKY